MSNEIATYSMILSKLSLGKSGTECPTKTQILAINSLIVIENASTYGANECVKIDDIRKKAETWNYYLTVSPTSMSFGAGGGSKSFTVSSYKRKVLDGVEQSGDTSVSLKSTTISGTGFSLSGTTVSASANEGTSNRTGTVTITQNESNKTATISLSQSEDTISSYGEWTISVSASPTSVSSSGGTSTITASAKRTIYWVSGDVTEETGNPTLSTNLGSLSSTSSPSTLTLGENTSTSSRTATITATYEGKSATCTVTQAADNYVFTWDDGSTSDTSASFPWDFSANGTAANIPVVSTKNGSSQSWSVSSKPSWITTSTTSSKVTISASDNSGSARSGTIVLTQSGSNKTLRIDVSQAAYSATVEWRYKIGFANGALSNISIVCRDYHAINQSSPITVTFLSYKSKYVDGVEDTSTRQYLDFSISSSQTWLTVTKETSSNANEGKFAFVVSENGSTSNRTGTITVAQSESQKTITCDTTQVGSDAFVASYFVKFRGSDTYPSEINFGLVTAPTSKEFEVESSLEIYTIDSEYNSYNYQFRDVIRVYRVNNFMNFTDNSWFTNTYEVGGGSLQYDLLTINAPVSDGQDRAVPIYIVQSRYPGDIDWNYRELTNSPIAGQIMVKQAGNKIS